MGHYQLELLSSYEELPKGIYPEVFRMAEKGKIYRGMALPMEFVEENFGGLPKKPKWYKAPIKWFLGQGQKRCLMNFN